MKRVLLMALVAFVTIANAQDNRFVVKGEMSCDSLCYSRGTVKSLNLVHNVGGESEVIATAEVVDGKFTFEGVAPDAIDVYDITGFDNGTIQIFLEPGEITVGPFDARYPVGAVIGGTPCNIIYNDYHALNRKCVRESKERMFAAKEALPADIKNNDVEQLKHTSSVFYANNLYFKVAIIDFVYKHIDSPVALYIINYSMFPTFTTDVINHNFLSAVPEHLRKHKMYKELLNKVRAASLAVGFLAPDVEGFTVDGKTVALSDLKGKYVLLDFWASWCAPCRREIPYLKEVLAYSEKNDKFAVLSYSIDSKEKDWKNCITNNNLIHKNWIHISTLKGWNSEAVKHFGAQGVPYTVLLDPEGRVLAFELRGEAMVQRIKKIIDAE